MTWEALTQKEDTCRLSIKPVSPFITVNLKNLGHVTSGLNFLEPFTAIFRTWSVYNHVHRKCVKPLSFWPVCNGELLWVCFGCLRQAGSTLTVKCSPSQDYNDTYSFSKNQWHVLLYLTDYIHVVPLFIRPSSFSTNILMKWTVCRHCCPECCV